MIIIPSSIHFMRTCTNEYRFPEDKNDAKSEVKYPLKHVHNRPLSRTEDFQIIGLALRVLKFSIESPFDYSL
jgi:hypothetical protein